MRITVFALLIFLISSLGCSGSQNRDRRGKESDKKTFKTDRLKSAQDSTESGKNRIAKVVLYLENSESMFGYFNNASAAYNDVVSEMAQRLRFEEEDTEQEFYFVNGKEPSLQVTEAGTSPDELKESLNNGQFIKAGDNDHSDLNAMFQMALKTAEDDTISLLISDALYDVGNRESPRKDLIWEGRETSRQFTKRLKEGNLQTIIVKLNSQFEGKYFPAVGGSEKLSQIRPYYLFIFGKAELLNEYFSDEYLQQLSGFTNLVRFLKINDLNINYQATTNDKLGSFKFSRQSHNKLVNVEKDRNGKGFQFTFAVDYSQLPFSQEYFTTTTNYTCNLKDYSIVEIINPKDIKLYGLDFEPSHLIKLKATDNPYGKLKVGLKNQLPDWIIETNADDENNLKENFNKTYGFQYLIGGISKAYDYKNKEKDIASFEFEISDKSNGGNGYWWAIVLILGIATTVIIYKKNKTN